MLLSSSFKPGLQNFKPLRFAAGGVYRGCSFTLQRTKPLFRTMYTGAAVSPGGEPRNFLELCIRGAAVSPGGEPRNFLELCIPGL